MYIEHGCLGDILSLSCPDSGEILITRADFGVYYLACSDCCSPNPVHDCFVDVQTVAPEYFDFLKFQCDSQNSCSFEYTGYLVDECQAGYVADYMQVLFDCLPFNSSGPVGFTAKASSSYNVVVYEIIQFDNVLSNIGGHYNPNTCSFVCPDHGMYLFSVTICTNEDALWIRLYKNNDPLTFAYANNDDTDVDCSSPTVITECDAGEIVWVMSWSNGFIYAGNEVPVFSGALLQRY